MKCTPAITQYLRSLTGEISLSLSGTPAEKEQAALEIIQYAITELLHIEPKVAASLVKAEDIELLGLKPLLKHISAPPGIDAAMDIDYYIHRAFPKEVPYRVNDQVLKKYSRIMAAGQEGKRQRFNRGMFSGQKGAAELSTLLMSLITQNVEYKDIGDLYRIFADTSRMNTVFKKKWRIYDAVKSIYSTPLQCLHASLPDEMKDNFLYGYYQFQNVYKSISV